MAKVESEKEDKIKEQKNLSATLNKKWAKKMLEQYIAHGSGNIQSFTDFKEMLENPNTNVVNKHIKKLCDIGILRHATEKKPKKKEKKGYIVVWKNLLNYYFKFRDMKLIQECPIENIYWDFFRSIKYRESKQTRNVTIYGLDRHYYEIETILENTYKKLIKPFNRIYVEKFNSIVSKECKTIQKHRLKQSVKEWCSELVKELLIIPPRDFYEDEPLPKIKYIPPKDLEQEFKIITEKIWNQFNKICPPIGIMIQF